MARSQMRETRPNSRIMRASVTSSACSADIESMSVMPSPIFALVGILTNAPPRAPTFVSIIPAPSSRRSASLTVTLLTPNCWQRSRSDGSRSPGRRWPSRTRPRIWSAINSEIRPDATGVNKPTLVDRPSVGRPSTPPVIVTPCSVGHGNIGGESNPGIRMRRRQPKRRLPRPTDGAMV